MLWCPQKREELFPFLRLQLQTEFGALNGMLFASRNAE